MAARKTALTATGDLVLAAPDKEKKDRSVGISLGWQDVDTSDMLDLALDVTLEDIGENKYQPLSLHLKSKNNDNVDCDVRFLTLLGMNLNKDYALHAGNWTIYLGSNNNQSYNVGSNIIVVSPGGTTLMAKVKEIKSLTSSDIGSNSNNLVVHLSENVYGKLGGNSFNLPVRIVDKGKSVQFITLLQSQYDKLAGKPDQICTKLYPSQYIIVVSGGNFEDTSATLISVMKPNGDFVYTARNSIDQPLVDLKATPTPAVRCESDRRIFKNDENFCAKCGAARPANKPPPKNINAADCGSEITIETIKL